MLNTGRSLASRFALLLSTGLLLTACGGGGGGASTGSTPAVPASPSTPTNPAIDKVQLAPGLPAATAPLIAELISPGGSGNLATGVQVREPGQTGEVTVLALDASGHIVLAARTEGDVASLGAASTAQALVRSLLGPLPMGSTAAQLNADISAAADFAALQSEVTAALARGVAPSVAPEVLALLVSTARQAGQVADLRRPSVARALAVLPNQS